MITNTAYRLDTALRAANIPIDGVGILDEINHVARIDYQANATAPQRQQGDAILAAFDWSPTAQTAFDNLQARAAVKAFLDGNDAQAKLIKAITIYLLQQIKVAVPVYTLPTKAQFANAIKNILDSGAAD